MKRIDKKIQLLLAFLLTSIMFISTVNAQDYNFGDGLIENVTYSWNVKTLEKTGVFHTSFLDIDDYTLQQGDNITAKLIADVDDIANLSYYDLWYENSSSWVEFYVNDDFVTNDTQDFDLIDLDWLNIDRSYYDWTGDYDFYFLLPISGTEDGVTVDYFDFIQDEFQQLTIQEKYDEKYTDYSYMASSKIIQSSKLAKNIWSLSVNWHFDSNEEDYTSEDVNDWDKSDIVEDIIIDLRFNTDTGLLVYLDYQYTVTENSETEGSIETETDALKLVIVNNELESKVPYNWLFSLLALFILPIIPMLRRKS